MTQQQTNIHVAAPGFSGINTQDSPVGMGLEYASVADNAVIDSLGRIGSRKGLAQVTTNLASTIGVNPIVRGHEFVDVTGVSWLFACGNGKIWLQDQEAPFELTEVPIPGSVTLLPDENQWQIVGLDDRCYFLQEGIQILEFHAAANTPAITGFTVMQTSVAANIYPTALGAYPSCGTTAFGHLFVAGFPEDKSTIYYTELNTGAQLEWEGSINLTHVWPSGADDIVAIKAHNNFLIIWGERTIVVYSLADGVIANAELVDTIEGIGCVARDSVCVTGKDILFLDSTGVRSFGRTIQEKSMPVGDLSYNVKRDIQSSIKAEPSENIVAAFSPEESLYVVSFPSQKTSYWLDTKEYLPNGSFKVTKSTTTAIKEITRASSGSLYFSGVGGMYEYTGTFDTTDVLGDSLINISTTASSLDVTRTSYPISFEYWTQPQAFGATSRSKFLKQIDVTAIGGGITDQKVFVRWSSDYNSYSEYTFFEVMGAQGYEFGETEFTSGDYSGDLTGPIKNTNVNIWGSGRTIKFGFDCKAIGSPFSIQELNIQALTGRIV